MKKIAKISAFLLLSVMFLSLTGCKKDPSVLKVFVRSAANQLIPGARVIIAGDTYSNPPTRAYADTMMSNSTGYAVFDMDKYFGEKPAKGEVGYFNIIVKLDNKTANSSVRVRANIANVQTVKFSN